jgi:hypothetical protein
MIDPQQLEVIVINTVAVLTSLPENLAEWREVLAGAWQRAADLRAAQEQDFLEVLLAHLDGNPPAQLAADNPYRQALDRIEQGVVSGGVQAPPLQAEVLQALNALLTSDTWADARRVLEAHEGVLLQPEVEAVLDQLAEQAVNDGKTELAQNFALHRDLIRLARQEGVAAAFDYLALQDGPHAGLAARAVSGLSGGPAQRMALAQYAAQRLKSEEDPAERGLLETIQVASFSKHPAAVKHKLEGEQARVWAEIVEKLKSRE